MSSNKNQDTEFKIQVKFPISNNEIIRKLKSPYQIFLFQYSNKQIEEIQKLIYEKSDCSLFRKVLNMLAELYSCNELYFTDHNNSILNKENVIDLCLLSLQIEIEVPKLEISNLILPIEFKCHLKIMNKNNNQFDCYKQLFDQLCMNFQLNDATYNAQRIYAAFHKLFYQLQLKPVDQKHRVLLEQFQKEREINQQDQQHRINKNNTGSNKQQNPQLKIKQIQKVIIEEESKQKEGQFDIQPVAQQDQQLPEQFQQQNNFHNIAQEQQMIQNDNQYSGIQYQNPQFKVSQHVQSESNQQIINEIDSIQKQTEGQFDIQPVAQQDQQLPEQFQQQNNFPNIAQEQQMIQNNNQYSGIQYSEQNPQFKVSQNLQSQQNQQIISEIESIQRETGVQAAIQPVAQQDQQLTEQFQQQNNFHNIAQEQQMIQNDNQYSGIQYQNPQFKVSQHVQSESNQQIINEIDSIQKQTEGQFDIQLVAQQDQQLTEQFQQQNNFNNLAQEQQIIQNNNQDSGIKEEFAEKSLLNFSKNSQSAIQLMDQQGIQNCDQVTSDQLQIIKNIYRVKNVKSLIRQQNQEIIISRSSNSQIPLGNDNVIYYNQKYDVKLSNKYNRRLKYTGQLDYNYEVQGKGILQETDINTNYEGEFKFGIQNGKGKQILLQQILEGFYSQGQKQGTFIVTHPQSKQISYANYKNDIFQWNYDNEQNFNLDRQRQLEFEQIYIEKEIVNSRNICLSTKILNTLKVGVWLQDSVVDYYLMEMKKHYKQQHLGKVNYSLFSVMNSQDVFSSDLQYKNFDYTQLTEHINLTFLKKELSNADKITLAKRTIFAMNLNKSHFITIVIEDNQIYILNSIQSDLSSVCKIMKESFKQLEIEIDYHPEEYQIKICQQNNHYSCGVHTCYVIHQLIKNYNQPIKQIKFNNTEANIEKYTTHMRNVILTKKSIHIETQIQ